MCSPVSGTVSCELVYELYHALKILYSVFFCFYFVAKHQPVGQKAWPVLFADTSNIKKKVLYFCPTGLLKTSRRTAIMMMCNSNGNYCYCWSAGAGEPLVAHTYRYGYHGERGRRISTKIGTVRPALKRWDIDELAKLQSWFFSRFNLKRIASTFQRFALREIACLVIRRRYHEIPLPVHVLVLHPSMSHCLKNKHSTVNEHEGLMMTMSVHRALILLCGSSRWYCTTKEWMSMPWWHFYSVCVYLFSMEKRHSDKSYRYCEKGIIVQTNNCTNKYNTILYDTVRSVKRIISIQ